MDIYALYSQAVEQSAAKNYDAALKILDEIKVYAPDYEKAYYMEANIWNKLKNPVKEYYALEKFLSLVDLSSVQDKNFIAEVFVHLGNILEEDLYLWEKALKAYLFALKLADKKKLIDYVEKNIFFFLNVAENYSAADFRAIYAECKKVYHSDSTFPKRFYNHKKIRVGFLSSDFFNHVMINWGMMLLTKLNKNLFEKYFYSNGKANDYITKYLRSNADYWHDIYDLTDSQVAKLIHDDEIDILFDLNGHTGESRIHVAAYRPATLQISGIGYMNSTGLDCFDYFLSDIYCAGDENYFTEKVIKLPHSHICYKPMIKIELANNFPPCLKNGFVTFGSFNKLGKMTDSVFITWRKILDAVPNSRLILKYTTFDKEYKKNFTIERLNNLGFDLTRVEMRPFTANHLVEYGDIDIALDPFPYTGGVTTCEALYMGVPVVSLYGARHGSRFGLSILKNIGIDELAVDSHEAYIERAVALAGDWELLTILRKNLRTMMEKSPLMDSENYIREIEEAFIKILNDERNR